MMEEYLAKLLSLENGGVHCEVDDDGAPSEAGLWRVGTGEALAVVCARPPEKWH